MGGTPGLTGEFTGETHRVLECTQTHTPENQHQKGPICLWVAEEGLKASGELSKQDCSLPELSSTYSATTQEGGLPYPGKYLRLCPLLHNRCNETKKYGPSERTDQSSKNRTKQ